MASVERGVTTVDGPAPLGVTPGIPRATAPVPPGVHSTSPPTADTSSSSRWSVDATVASRIGSARSPPRTISPSTPTEKSPDTGFTPECSPLIDWTSTPRSTPATRSSSEPSPGATCSAWAPTPGVER